MAVSRSPLPSQKPPVQQGPYNYPQLDRFARIYQSKRPFWLTSPPGESTDVT